VVDVEALLRENAAQRRALEAQQLDLASQRAQIALLVDQIAKLNDRIGELLAIAQRKQRKPSVAKPPEPPVVDEATKTAFEKRPKPRARGKRATVFAQARESTGEPSAR